MTNYSVADFERRILAISKNYHHRDTGARERSMRKILRDMGEAPVGGLANQDCAKLVAMLVEHWPQGAQAPTIAALSGQLANLRVGRARWEKLQAEAATSLTKATNSPPDQLPAPDPAYTGANGRLRKGTNHSIYLRQDALAWYTSQCPQEQRGKAELTRGIHAVFERVRGTISAPASSTGSPHAVDNLPEEPPFPDPLEAIDFALSGKYCVGSECAEFLRLWREGCWAEIHECFPDFVLPDSILKTLVRPELPGAQPKEFDPLHDDE